MVFAINMGNKIEHAPVSVHPNNPTIQTRVLYLLYWIRDEKHCRILMMVGSSSVKHSRQDPGSMPGKTSLGNKLIN